MWLFNLYRKFISPFLHALSITLSGNPHTGCRFDPTCSVYTQQAIQKYGWFRGLYLGFRRVLRCHPWNTSGGKDPC